MPITSESDTYLRHTCADGILGDVVSLRISTGKKHHAVDCKRAIWVARFQRDVIEGIRYCPHCGEKLTEALDAASSSVSKPPTDNINLTSANKPPEGTPAKPVDKWVMGQ